ncbi:MAG: hypothetical protein IKG84_00500 [Bacteroidales bacterium]|nr:hypothetical protein [Bacteroidales bacterium]
MKTIRQYIAIAALAVSAAACTPEFPVPNQAGLPQASDLDVTISVDQNTNYVTFVMNNKGVVPVWIFGDQKIDGKASKKYAYTENGVSLRFRDAGEYTVEVKAYNANGLSQGSLVQTFTLDNTYRDPFDPSPYVKAVSGGDAADWVWNSTENGHFGCGPVGNPLGWWSCEANGKKGFLYDDVMTFSADGNYTFRPGDGQAYANKGSEYKSEYKTADEDYLFATEEKTSKYTFENNWNDAGIEEIFLVLEAGSELSYVPHKSIVSEPRYQVLETKTSEMKKKLKLMATVFTPDNQDGISWYYEFVPFGSNPDAADPLFGFESKTWILDNDAQGYMGCGSGPGNPTEWWSAAPHDKDSFGVTDDEITFFKNGGYVFDPGADGLVYCNWESGYLPDGHSYSGDGKTDYDAPAQRQESTYTLGSDANGDYIELPAGIFFTYVPRPEVLTQPTKLYIKENTADKLVLVPSFEGIISWQLIFKPKDGQAGPGGDDEYKGEYIYSQSDNLFTDSTYGELETWFSPGDWSGGLDAQESYANGTVTLTVPAGVGGAEWMGQVKLHTGIAINPKAKYNYSAKITASDGGTFTAKNTSASDPGGAQFFYDNELELEAGETFLLQKNGLSMDSSENMMIIFDFGRLAPGTEVTISDIEVSEVTPIEARLETWFTAQGWGGGLDPQGVLSNGVVTLTVPEGIGGDEWMGQTKIHTNFEIDPSATYYYSVTIESTESGVITLKNTSESDPGGVEFFYDGGVEITGGTPLVYEREEMTMASDETLLLIFDFGRMPVGTQITIKDFVIREK